MTKIKYPSMSRINCLRIASFCCVFFATTNQAFSSNKIKKSIIRLKFIYQFFLENSRRIRIWAKTFSRENQILEQYSDEILLAVVLIILISIGVLYIYHEEKWGGWLGKLLILFGLFFLFILISLIDISYNLFWLNLAI